MSAISSRQTRSIAGASCSWYSPATARDDRVERGERLRDRGSGDRQLAAACSARKKSAWTSWKSAPRVSGSSFCSGSGSSAGSSR